MTTFRARLAVADVADHLRRFATTAQCEHLDRDALLSHCRTLRATERLGTPSSTRQGVLRDVAADLERSAGRATCCHYQRPVLHLAERLGALSG